MPDLGEPRIELGRLAFEIRDLFGLAILALSILRELVPLLDVAAAGSDSFQFTLPEQAERILDSGAAGQAPA